MMRAVVILNPVAGKGRATSLDACSALARRILEPLGYRTDVVITRNPGHGHGESVRARDDGVDLVIAWGGDGTVNEVARGLAFSSSTLAIVPAGSGNGLARDLGIPADPTAALQVAGTGRTRRIDAGELDGTLFFNVAGVGLDAAIAARLALPNAPRRLKGYILATLQEWPRYAPQRFRLGGDRFAYEGQAWFIAFANSRQYGNDAQIAPAARLDDGLLDVVVVEARPRWRLALDIPAFFRGTLDNRPGIVMAQASELTVSIERPVAYHLDGETGLKEASLTLRARPGILAVKSP